MAEKEQSTRNEDERPPSDYAFWDALDLDAPGEKFRIIYSLQLFHEIDFVVNEGYRKIPHGGIETAGLLFGTVRKDELTVEAFRPIPCEHAAGPSLNFSKQDLEELEKQIQSTSDDSELAQYQPVGWFLGHTRSGLELTDAEQQLFSRFFPGAHRVTVIVKPERFQPTRFGFLVRNSNGEMQRDSSAAAIILPLPGRSFKPGQLVASIPAPKVSAAKRPARSAETEEATLGPTEVPKVPEARVQPPPTPRLSQQEAGRSWTEATTDESESERKTDAPGKAFPGLSPDQRKKLVRNRVRKMEETFPDSEVQDAPAEPPKEFQKPPIPIGFPRSSGSPSAPSSPRGSVVPITFRATPSTVPIDAPRRKAPGYGRRVEESLYERAKRQSVLNVRSLTALALGALMGVVVGYLAYLQLPAPIISLDVRPVDQTIIISWPPAETRSATYAAIRLNDGAPVPLTQEEKKSGHIALSAIKDFKVEVVAHNWLRDSRGIVRYLRSTSAVAQTDPPLPQPPAQ